MTSQPPWEPLAEPPREPLPAGQQPPPWGPQWQPQPQNHQPPDGAQRPGQHAPWEPPYQPQQPVQQAPWSLDQRPGSQAPYAGPPWASLPAGRPENVTQAFPAGPNGHRAGPPSRRHRRRNVILFAIGIVLLLGAIGAALSVGQAPSPKPAAATTPAARATTAPAAAATTAPAPNSTAEALINWWNNGGKNGMNQIMAAEQDVAQQAQAQNFSGAAQACAGLATAVSNEKANGPIPDHRAEKWFARALSKYDTAAAECQAGASTLNGSALTQAANDMNLGTRDLGKATVVIKALSGE